jgi:hypothetical protein
VQTARRILAGAALRTPMLPSPKLSALTGAEVFVKYENLQVTNSFKDRGAYVKLASLSEAQRGRGVIAMSIGNHAQAVAYHSQRLGIPATIVMPATTPFAKVKTTEAYGAKVVLDGETLGECQKRAIAIARDHALILVPPYDDPAIIAAPFGAPFAFLTGCLAADPRFCFCKSVNRATLMSPGLALESFGRSTSGSRRWTRSNTSGLIATSGL